MRNIRGIGIDIEEVVRFQQRGHNSRDVLLKKLFTPEEIGYCLKFANAASHFAGHFALKEAVLKAVSPRSYSLTDIEVRHKRNGKPHIAIDGKLCPKIFVSISHTNFLACAIAIITDTADRAI